MACTYPIKSETLWLATLSYLALPIGIFAIGWLSPAWAVLVIVSIAAGLYFRPQPTEECSVQVPLWSLFPLALGCIAVCLLAGVGGFGYQDGDYYKHNAILADLFRRDWPVTYTIEREGTKHPVALVYYFAYYLPPAVIGKLAGWEALRYSMVLWTSGGMFIMSLWCLKFTKGALWSPLAFLAFGGFDVVGMLLGIKVFSWMPELWLEHRQMEWWAGFSFGTIPSHSSHLFWAPQHALPGWLIAAGLLHRIRSGRLAGCLFLASLAPLWSPLVALGLLPIGLAGLLASRGKGVFSHSNLAAFPLLVMGGLFFSARGIPGVPFPPVPFGWNDIVPLKLVSTFILEILPWALLLLISSKAYTKGFLQIVLTCLIFLAALPLWRVGAFNDLMMRASLPALTLLSLLLLQKSSTASTRWRKAAFVTLIAGAGGLAFDLLRHVEFTGDKASQTDFSSPAKVPILPAAPDLADLLEQYLGSPSAAFFRLAARPLPLASDSVTYDRQEPPSGAIESQNRMQLELRRRFEKGERSKEFLQQYSTVSYIQSEYWEAMLALEVMVELYPQDPNVHLKLASLLTTSSIKAYHLRARTEFEIARRLAGDTPEFNQFTSDLQILLEQVTGTLR